MTGHRWRRTAAFLLAGGMLLSQGGYVYAAEQESAEMITAEQETGAVSEVTPVTETVPEEVTASTEEAPLYALDASGASVQVSDTVCAMIHDGTVYLDEASGYLRRTVDGIRVDPVSGEAFPKEETSQPALEEGGEAGADDGQAEPEDPETAGDRQENGETGDIEEEDTSDTPGSGTEPEKENGGTEDGNEPPEEQMPEDAQTEVTQPEPEDIQKDEGQPETEEPRAEEGTGASDRESLIQGTQIVQAPVIVDDFRFWTVARKYGFAKEDLFYPGNVVLYGGNFRTEAEDPAGSILRSEDTADYWVKN